MAVLFCSALSATASRAGAFLQPPGEGLAIVGGAFTDAVRAYDSEGRLVPVTPWRKFELTTYAEYGVTEWLTAIASPSLFMFRQDSPGQNRGLTGIAEAGARVRLLDWTGGIVSGQAIVRGPLAGAAAWPFVDTTRFVQFDARLAIGHNFELLGFQAFSDVQVGFRSSGNYGHQARFDGTLGVRLTDAVLLLLQNFTTVTPGRIGQSLYLQQKASVSAVWWITPSFGFQVGGIAGLKGVNSGAERGGFSALWVRF